MGRMWGLRKNGFNDDSKWILVTFLYSKDKKKFITFYVFSYATVEEKWQEKSIYSFKRKGSWFYTAISGSHWGGDLPWQWD